MSDNKKNKRQQGDAPAVIETPETVALADRPQIVQRDENAKGLDGQTTPAKTPAAPKIPAARHYQTSEILDALKGEPGKRLAADAASLFGIDFASTVPQIVTAVQSLALPAWNAAGLPAVVYNWITTSETAFRPLRLAGLDDAMRATLGGENLPPRTVPLALPSIASAEGTAGRIAKDVALPLDAVLFLAIAHAMDDRAAQTIWDRVKKVSDLSYAHLTDY